MPIIQTELWLPASLEDVWAFHKNPQSLLKITPNFLKLVLSGVPETIGAGSTFNIRSQNRFLNRFFNWAVQYEDWVEEPNYKKFIDVQSQGPFKSWHHVHEFKRGTEQLSIEGKIIKPKEPGTWVIDTIEYSLKSHMRAGQFIAEKVLPQLFVYRKKLLVKMFEPKSNDQLINSK